MKDYIVRKANETDLEAISTIYEKIHDLEEKGKQTIGWIRNIYPTNQTAREAIKRKDMFVLEKKGKVIASAIINQQHVDVYKKGKWHYQVQDKHVCVLHTLVISPDISGKGYGKIFVKFYEDYARKMGWDELRMDTNERNQIARSLYKKLGYQEIGIVPTVFNGIPNINLVLLEKHLNK